MFRDMHMNEQGHILTDMPQWLRKHDILYKAPAYDACDGLPIGNGDTGGLLATTPRALTIQLNHTDLYDDAPDGDFGAWGAEWEEKCTNLVGGAQLTISDGLPSFDDTYLRSFEERLILGEGRITLQSQTPFSGWQMEAFGSDEDAVLCFDCHACSEFPTERTVSLEKWGSRSYFHYYEQILNDPAVRLGGTDSGVQDGCAYVSVALRRLRYVCAAMIVGGDARWQRIHMHEARAVLPASANADFKVFVTIVSSEAFDNPLEEAIRRLHAASVDPCAVSRRSREQWRRFWDGSFVKLQDDYLENIYYLNLYVMQCSFRGKNPALFNGGIWFTDRDNRNWGHFYHWNNQQQYWNVHAAGHPELFVNYADYRRRMLPIACENGERLHGGGAFYSDIANRLGYQAIEPDTMNNLTCGPQIALDLYRHYLYTVDEAYLRDTALPVMEACAELYLHKLCLEEDGLYHLESATVYEGYLALKDTYSDRVFIESLFRSYLEATKGEGRLAAQIGEVLEHLYPYCTAQVNGVECISAGLRGDGTPLPLNGAEYPEAPFGTSEISAFYPGAEQALAHMPASIYEALVRTLHYYAKTNNLTCGHAPVLLSATRIGMTDYVWQGLRKLQSNTQCFTNGLCHFIDAWSLRGNEQYSVRLLDGTEKSQDWARIHEKGEYDRVSIPAKRFVHFYSETMGQVNATIQDALLQSTGGLIRVFPAAQKEGLCMFRLTAHGGVVVTSEQNDGEIRCIVLASSRDTSCTVEIPWDGQTVVRTEGERDTFLSDSRLSVTLKAERPVTLFPRSRNLDVVYRTAIESTPNQTVKRCGRAVLGVERRF